MIDPTINDKEAAESLRTLADYIEDHPEKIDHFGVDFQYPRDCAPSVFLELDVYDDGDLIGEINEVFKEDW